MLKIHVRYHLNYRYQAPVSLSRHEFRILPRQDRAIQMEAFDIQCLAAKNITFRKDLFDNEFVSIFVPQPVDNVDLEMNFTASVEHRNPFDFLLDKNAEKTPFSLTPEETKALEPYLKKSETLNLPDDLKIKPGSETVSALCALTHWHFTNIQYERREIGNAKSPSQTLAEKSGACRDVAALFAEVLRVNGIPARLVSGFLATHAGDPEAHRSANALHAWVDAYLPGAGWVGCDPTNGILCDHLYLATAVGPTMDAVAPIRGNYFSNEKTAGELTSTVEVTIEE